MTISRRSFIQKVTVASAASLVGINRAYAGKLKRLSSDSFNDFRDLYMLSGNLSYLNHGSAGTTPQMVHEAHLSYLSLCEQNPSYYIWGEEWKNELEQVREEVANFVGAKATEVALTRNTTEGMNVLAAGLRIGKGDEVLFSSLNHASASVCWSHYSQRKGYSVRSFEIDINQEWKTEEQIADLYLDQLTTNTKVLVLPHMDNLIGLRHPVKLIAKEARKRGVEYIVVDGAQTVGMFDIDISDLNVDFYATSTHKWLGSPKGVGFLYIKEDRLKTLPPLIVGNEHRPAAGTIQRFEEYSTRNLPEVLAVGHCVQFIENIGLDQFVQVRKGLRDLAFEKLKNVPSVKLVSPEDWNLNGSMFSLKISEETDLKQLEQHFMSRNVVVRLFQFQETKLIRISPNICSTSSDIDKLVEAIN